MKNFKQYKDCYYTYEKGILTAGNKFIERKIDFSGNVPYSISLKNKENGDEWLDTHNPATMLGADFIQPIESPCVEVSGSVEDDVGIAGEHLKVTVELEYNQGSIRLETMLYPYIPLLRHVFAVKGFKQDTSKDLHRYSQYIVDDNRQKIRVESKDFVDSLELDDLHCKWNCISFMDATDINNNLVQENRGVLYPAERRLLQGNIMVLRKILKDSGLLLIKEGPTPFGYITETHGDYQFQGKRLSVIGSGISRDDLRPDEYMKAYGTAIGVWSGREYEYLKLVDKYHKSIHKYIPERDFFVMSNTWGDRSQDGRVSERFIMAELDRAREIGLTHLQIDDGWQQGTTSNSVNPNGVWADYYSNPEIDFWAVNKERFPNGLEKVAVKAEEYNIKLGLWFSPDSPNDYKNWERDADTLLGLYARYGIRYFKLDGIKIRSKKGEQNLVRMMQKVVRDSSGEVYFNIDVTGGDKRLGYLDQTQYASIFLENRYTDWKRYYPHFTLRNLWMLSRYLPAQKFQIEFLNVERNRDKYGDDLLAPAIYGIAYAFGITMFSNPLAWMELTGLTKEDAAVLGRMMKVYREYQGEILSGHILPIGEEPSGVSWTGFQSIINDKEGFILVIREYNQEPFGRVKLWNIHGSELKVNCLMRTEGRNKVVTNQEINLCESFIKPDQDGRYRFELKNALSLALYKYQVK